MKFLKTLFKGFAAFINLAVFDLIIVLLFVGRPPPGDNYDAGGSIAIFLFWIFLLVPTFVILFFTTLGIGVAQYLRRNNKNIPKIPMILYITLNILIFTAQIAFISWYINPPDIYFNH